MAEKTDLFLSYSKKDKGFVDSLAEHIQKIGYTFWIDTSGIRGGEDWNKALEGALENCTAFLACITPSYIQSEFCMKELHWAVENHKPVIPILAIKLADMQRDWPICIQRLQYIDFSMWETTGIQDDLIDKLKKSLQKIFEPNDLSIEQKYLNQLIAEMKAKIHKDDYIELGAQIKKSETQDRGLPMDGDLERLERSRKGRELPLRNSTRARDQYEKKHLKNIHEALRKHDIFVLLGGGGSGKTTTLRYLAILAAESRLSGSDNAPLPLYLELPVWLDNKEPEGQEISDFIRQHYPFEEDPAPLLKSGKILLLLDGLNEMGYRGKIKAQNLKQWIQKSAVKRAIITCRTADYNRQLQLNLPEVFIEQLTNEKIEEYAFKQLGQNAKIFLEHLFPMENQNQNGASHWLTLSRTPMFLYYLTTAFYHYQGKLPKNPGELFQKLIAFFWNYEGRKNTTGWIPLDAMKERLGRLAYAMFNEEKETNVPLDWALQQIADISWIQHLPEKSVIEDEEFLRVAQGCSLIELKESPQGKTLSFYHPIIQEYFAAEAILQKPSIEMLNEAARVYYELDQSEEGKNLLHLGRIEGRWDQAIMMLCGFPDNRDEVFSVIIDKDPYLAARCIHSGIEVSDANLEKLIDNLLSTIQTPGKEDRQWTGAADLDFIESDLQTTNICEPSRLLKQIPDKDLWVREIAAAALAFVGEPAVEELISLLHNQNPDIVSASISGLTLGGYPSACRLLEVSVSSDDRLSWYAAAIFESIISSEPHLAGDIMRKVGKELKQDPENTGLLLQKAGLMVSTGSYSASLEVYNQCVSHESLNPLAHSGLINAHLRLKDKKSALDAFELAEKLNIQSFSVYMAGGSALYDSEHFMEASTAFRAASKLDPTFFQTFIEIGYCYTSAENPEEAIAAFETARKLARNNLDIWRGLSYCQLQKESYDEAIVAFEKCLQLSYEGVGRKYEGLDRGNLGICYGMARQYARAIDAFTVAYQISEEVNDRENQKTWLAHLSSSYDYLGNFEKALSQNNLALGISRSEGVDKGFEIDMLSEIGFLCMDMGRFQEALGYFQQALELARKENDRQKEHRDLDNVGYCMYWLGDTCDGIKLQQQALDFKVTDSDQFGEAWIYFTFAAAEIDRKDYAKAKEHAMASLAIGEKLDDKDILREANFQLARAQLFSGECVAAEKALQKIEIDATSKHAPKLYALLGLIQIELGDFDAAQSSFIEVLFQSNRLLKYCSQNYAVLDAKGLAYSGLTICRRNNYVRKAVDAYIAARSITQSPIAVLRASAYLSVLSGYDEAGKLKTVRAAAAGKE